MLLMVAMVGYALIYLSSRGDAALSSVTLPPPQGRATEILPFLVKHHYFLSRVKSLHQRHQRIPMQSLDLWATFFS
jgi:hypothetical protein